jgi:hypothetical protein
LGIDWRHHAAVSSKRSVRRVFGHCSGEMVEMLLPSTCCRPVVKRRAPVRPYSVQARAVACWSPRPASFLAGGRAPGPPSAACARCQQTFRLARPDLAGRALTITRQLLAWIALPARRQGGPSILTAHDYLRAGYHGRTGGGGAGTQRDTVHQQTPFKLTHPPSIVPDSS